MSGRGQKIVAPSQNFGLSSKRTISQVAITRWLESFYHGMWYGLDRQWVELTDNDDDTLDVVFPDVNPVTEGMKLRSFRGGGNFLDDESFTLDDGEGVFLVAGVARKVELSGNIFTDASDGIYSSTLSLNYLSFPIVAWYERTIYTPFWPVRDFLCNHPQAVAYAATQKLSYFGLTQMIWKTTATGDLTLSFISDQVAAQGLWHLTVDNSGNGITITLPSGAQMPSDESRYTSGSPGSLDLDDGDYVLTFTHVSDSKIQITCSKAYS
jgi:hypothetical protein